MRGDIEKFVRENFVKMVASEVALDDLDPDLDMVDEYGLTSLNKVLFLTLACEATDVALVNFTEDDLVGMRTLRNVIDALVRHAETPVS